MIHIRFLETVFMLVIKSKFLNKSSISNVIIRLLASTNEQQAVGQSARGTV